MSADVAWLFSAVDHPDFLLSADDPDLSASEARRFSFYLNAYMRIREFAWFQYKTEILDEATFESYMTPTAFIFIFCSWPRLPGTQCVWWRSQIQCLRARMGRDTPAA